MTTRSLLPFTVWLLVACGSGTIRPTDEPAPRTEPGNPPPVEPTPAPAPEPSTSPTSPSPAPASGSKEIRRIGQWSNTGIAESRHLIIQDNRAWTELWSQLGVGEQAPQVDFNRNVVIAVSMGQRSSGGYDVAVQGVTEIAGELTVDVVETSPALTCATTMALTQPVDVVVVVGAAGARSWNFREKKETRGC
jgi:PrcB C-terminal